MQSSLPPPLYIYVGERRVTDYLKNKTQNVLVTSSNATMTSDLRVFESDGNSTMRRWEFDEHNFEHAV